MKRILIITALCYTAFAANAQENIKKSTAKVAFVRGFYIFTDSEPLAEFNYLGDEKVISTWSGTYREIREKMIGKVRKNYPSADGIIFNLSEGTIDRATVIKFKE